MEQEKSMLILLKYKGVITSALLSFLLLFAVSSCKNRDVQIDYLKVNHQLELSKERELHITQIRESERTYYEQNIEAINEYKKREQVIINDNINARDAVASLSDTIDTLAANAEADASFRIQYASTTGNLLKDCSKEYIGLAATADRISNDLRAIQAANRRQ